MDVSNRAWGVDILNIINKFPFFIKSAIFLLSILFVANITRFALSFGAIDLVSSISHGILVTACLWAAACLAYYGVHAVWRLIRWGFMKKPMKGETAKETAWKEFSGRD